MRKREVRASGEEIPDGTADGAYAQDKDLLVPVSALETSVKGAKVSDSERNNHTVQNDVHQRSRAMSKQKIILTTIVVYTAIFMSILFSQDILQTLENFYYDWEFEHVSKELEALHYPLEDITKLMAAPRRGRMHLLTDRPLYRPGESIQFWVTAYDLHTGDAIPEEVLQRSQFEFVLLNQKQVEVERHPVFWAMSYFQNAPIPSNLPGGVYQIKIQQVRGEQHAQTRADLGPILLLGPGTREIEVRLDSKANPQLSAEVQLHARGYRPGEKVQATVSNVRDLSIGDGSRQGVFVQAHLLVDGVRRWASSVLPLDAQGTRSFWLSLPSEPFHQATLSVQVNKDPRIRTYVVPIPLVQEVHVNFFPNSGHLVEGCQNKVFFEARSSRTGEPVDIRGNVIDSKENVISHEPVETGHEGRGWFFLTPIENEAYFLRLTGSDSRETFELPRASPGISIDSEPSGDSSSVYEDEAIHFEVCSSRTTSISLNLWKNDLLISSTTAKSTKYLTSQHSLQLKGYSGVLRLSASSEQHSQSSLETLYGEILKFVDPLQKIDVEISGQSTVTSNSAISLEVSTNKQASLAITVVDLSRLKQYPTRRWHPSLRESVLLENEVDEFLSVNDYLGENRKALDLLLGVQGWRKRLFNNLKSRWSQRNSNGESLRLAKLLGVPETQLYFGAQDPKRSTRKSIIRFQSPWNQDEQQDLVAFAAVGGMLQVENHRDARFQRFVHFKNAMALPAMGEQENANIFDQDDIAEDFGVPENPMLAKRMARHGGFRIRQQSETIYANLEGKTVFDHRSQTYSWAMNFNIMKAGTYLVRIDAWDENGALGQADKELVVSEPLSIELDIPAHAFTGDVLILQLVLRAKPHEEIKTFITHYPLPSNNKQDSTGKRPGVIYESQLKANSEGLVSAKITANLHQVGVNTFRVYAHSESGGKKRGQYSLQVNDYGVDIVKNIGGITKGEVTEVEENFGPLPDNIIKKKVTVEAEVFFQMGSQVIKSLGSLIAEPHGCFEQTSSTTYPMLLLLRSLLSLDLEDQRDPGVQQLIGEAQAKLRNGYARLIKFEASTGGYDWFGRSPGHEALTAYGLVQFAEMRRPELGLGNLVDEEMFARTKNWLMSRRDGQGSFKRSVKALDSFGRAPELTTNAYITWSLLRSQVLSSTDLQPEILQMRANLEQSIDPYVLALSVSALIAVQSIEQQKAIDAVLFKLTTMQSKVTGCVEKPEAMTITTQVNAFGYLNEVTALAAIAWLESKQQIWQPNARRAIQCIAARMQNNNFGSTQATALALQAFTLWNEAQKGKEARGVLALRVNAFPKTKLNFTSSKQNIIEEYDVGQESKFQVNMLVKYLANHIRENVPYLLSVKYKVGHPVSSTACALHIAFATPKITLFERLTTSARQFLPSPPTMVGSVVTKQLQITNTRRVPVSMPILRVGYESGLEPDMEALRSLVSSTENGIEMFEVTPGLVTLYWRGLEAKAQEEIALVFIARHIGQFTTHATHAYLYYEPEHRTYLKSDFLTIAPRADDVSATA